MGRLISDRMTYRNHYMCSGEASSTIVLCQILGSVSFTVISPLYTKYLSMIKPLIQKVSISLPSIVFNCSVLLVVFLI